MWSIITRHHKISLIIIFWWIFAISLTLTVILVVTLFIIIALILIAIKFLITIHSWYFLQKCLSNLYSFFLSIWCRWAIWLSWIWFCSLICRKYFYLISWMSTKTTLTVIINHVAMLYRSNMSVCDRIWWRIIIVDNWIFVIYFCYFSLRS